MDSIGKPEPKVLFIASALKVGGAERLWANLIPALQSEGMGVAVVAVNQRGDIFDQLGSRGVRTSFMDAGSGARSMRCLPFLARSVRRDRPDAIVALGHSAFAISALLGRLCGVPVIVNWHRSVSRPLDRRSTLACRLTARLGAGAICVSEGHIRDLVALGFRPDRIRVVPNAVPAPQEAPRPGPSTGANGVRVCLVARLEEVKRIDRFIEAMSIASKHCEGLHGIVVGQGPLMDELSDLRDRLGAPVELKGFHPEPTSLMLASDIVCLTSDFEAAPVVLMEAAACGRPVVATQSGSVNQIVKDGLTGIVAHRAHPDDVAEHLLELVNAPATRERMGTAARRVWEDEFALDRMVQGYLGLLQKVSGPPVRWDQYDSPAGGARLDAASASKS